MCKTVILWAKPHAVVNALQEKVSNQAGWLQMHPTVFWKLSLKKTESHRAFLPLQNEEDIVLACHINSQWNTLKF